MTIRLILLSIALGAAFPPILGAESIDCTNPVVIIPDGRITQSSFPQATTYWYGIYGQAGHSYNVEFEPASDNYSNSAHAVFAGINVFGPGDSLQGCRGTSSVAVTQTSGYAPVILKNGNGAGRRVSFTARTAGLHVISVFNGGGAGGYSFRSVDTTLFNPRWSTWNGYLNQWGFVNRSDMPVTGNLSVYDSSNSMLVSVQIVVPAGGEVMRASYPNDINLSPNHNGYAVFSHNGPPGAILADAYMISPTGASVIFSKFEGFDGR
jgi:hypothetical protein